jgi:hypothetical protein
LKRKLNFFWKVEMIENEMSFWKDEKVGKEMGFEKLKRLK